MKTLEDIKLILEENKEELQERYPIAELGIFGSYVREDQTKDSDVDVLVKFDGPIGLRFVDLMNDLTELIGVKTDLVEKEALKPKLARYINQDLIYV